MLVIALYSIASSGIIATKYVLHSLEFQSFTRSLEQFFLTVGQNNFGNKIPFLKTQDIKNTHSENCTDFEWQTDYTYVLACLRNRNMILHHRKRS